MLYENEYEKTAIDAHSYGRRRKEDGDVDGKCERIKQKPNDIETERDRE